MTFKKGNEIYVGQNSLEGVNFVGQGLGDIQDEVIEGELEQLGGNPFVSLSGKIIINGIDKELNVDNVDIAFWKNKKSIDFNFNFNEVANIFLPLERKKDVSGNILLDSFNTDKLVYKGGWEGFTSSSVFLSIGKGKDKKQYKYICNIKYNINSGHIFIDLKPSSVNDVEDIQDKNIIDDVKDNIKKQIDTSYLDDGFNVLVDDKGYLQLYNDDGTHRVFIDFYNAFGKKELPFSINDFKRLEEENLSRFFRDSTTKQRKKMILLYENEKLVIKMREYAPYLIDISSLKKTNAYIIAQGMMIENKSVVSYEDIYSYAENNNAFVYTKNEKNGEQIALLFYKKGKNDNIIGMKEKNIPSGIPSLLGTISFLSDDTLLDHVDFTLAGNNTLVIKDTSSNVEQNIILSDALKFVKKPIFEKITLNTGKILYVRLEKTINNTLDIQVDLKKFKEDVSSSDDPFIYDPPNNNESNELVANNHIHSLSISEGLTRDDYSNTPITGYDDRLYTEDGDYVVSDTDKKNGLYIWYDKKNHKMCLYSTDTFLWIDRLNPDDAQMSFDKSQLVNTKDGGEILLQIDGIDISLKTYRRNGTLRFGASKSLLDRREQKKSDEDIIENVKEYFGIAVTKTGEFLGYVVSLPFLAGKRVINKAGEIVGKVVDGTKEIINQFGEKIGSFFKNNIFKYLYGELEELSEDIKNKLKDIDRNNIFANDEEVDTEPLIKVQEKIEGYGAVPNSVRDVFYRKYKNNKKSIQLYYDPSWILGDGYDQVGTLELTSENIIKGIQEGIDITMGPFLGKEKHMKIYFKKRGDTLVIQVDPPSERIPEEPIIENKVERVKGSIWPVEGFKISTTSLDYLKALHDAGVNLTKALQDQGRKENGETLTSEEEANLTLAKKIGEKYSHGFVGFRNPTMEGSDFHQGIDINTTLDNKKDPEKLQNSDVRLPIDCTIVEAKDRRGSQGNTVVVHCIIQGVKYTMKFLHLSKLENLQKGKKYEKGTIIGKVGNTGTKYPHLHRGMWQGDKENVKSKLINPLDFFGYPGIEKDLFRENKKKKTLEKKNQNEREWIKEEKKISDVDKKLLQFLTYQEAKSLFTDIFGNGPATNLVDGYAKNESDLFIRILAIARGENSDLRSGHTNPDSGGYSRGLFQIHGRTDALMIKNWNDALDAFGNIASVSDVSRGKITTYNEEKQQMYQEKAQRDLAAWLGYVWKHAGNKENYLTSLADHSVKGDVLKNLIQDDIGNHVGGVVLKQLDVFNEGDTEGGDYRVEKYKKINWKRKKESEGVLGNKALSLSPEETKKMSYDKGKIIFGIKTGNNRKAGIPVFYTLKNNDERYWKRHLLKSIILPDGTENSFEYFKKDKNKSIFFMNILASGAVELIYGTNGSKKITIPFDVMKKIINLGENEKSVVSGGVTYQFE